MENTGKEGKSWKSELAPCSAKSTNPDPAALGPLVLQMVHDHALPALLCRAVLCGLGVLGAGTMGHVLP